MLNFTRTVGDSTADTYGSVTVGEGVARVSTIDVVATVGDDVGAGVGDTVGDEVLKQ